jgi:hypothetical protein
MHINQIRTLLATTPPTTRASVTHANDDVLLLASRSRPLTDPLHATVRVPMAPRHWL